MNIPILQPPVKDWYCPNCTQTDQTREARPHTRCHSCPGTRGMAIPFLEVGVKAKVEARDREDYVGNELVQKDANGRPIMSVVTTRDEGQDCMVFAPTAVLRGDA